MKHGIEWSTAEVHAGELRVGLVPDPDFAFMEAFDMMLIEHPGAAGSAWGRVQIAQGRIVVGDVGEGAADDLRNYLDDLVHRANAIAEPERKHLEEDVAHDRDEQARRAQAEKAAAEANERRDEGLAEEFRRPS